jgi:hypothetical protein
LRQEGAGERRYVRPAEALAHVLDTAAAATARLR